MFHNNASSAIDDVIIMSEILCCSDLGHLGDHSLLAQLVSETGHSKGSRL